MDGFYELDGECKPCEGTSSKMPMAITVVLCVVGLLAMAFIVNRNLLMQSNDKLMCVVVAGLMLTGVQTLGVFQQVAVP